MKEDLEKMKMSNDTLDAKRWRALINSQRIRILGSSGLGNDDYQHFGVELWDKYPERDGLKEKNEYGKKVFTKYVDTIIERESSSLQTTNQLVLFHRDRTIWSNHYAIPHIAHDLQKNEYYYCDETENLSIPYPDFDSAVKGLDEYAVAFSKGLA